MNTHEKRITFILASIISMRMMGLFMILPVFALYANELPDHTPVLIGLAIGIYGLTQALLQIPFGLLSDRWGRKRIIIIGLLIFILGSVVAALSTTLIGIIIGRALQGCGAIASVVLALTADLTREEERTKAMAVIGVSIGFSFVLSLILGPVLNQWIGVPGIFWLTALLALLAILFLKISVPDPIVSRIHRETEPIPTQFKRMLTHPQLLRLDVGIFLLHLSLTALFVVFPLSLAKQLPTAQHWQIYLPVMLGAFLAIIPLIIYGEKRHHLKLIFVAAIALLAISQLGMSYLHTHFIGSILMLFLFFTAFNLLEAALPSLISKTAPSESRGTAMGIYSTAQFLGAFFGGLLGGWLYHHYGTTTVFLFSAFMASTWFILALTMQPPRYLCNQLLTIGKIDKKRANQLTQCLLKVPGVAEVVVILEEGIAYLKVECNRVDANTLKEKCPVMRALLKY